MTITSLNDLIIQRADRSKARPALRRVDGSTLTYGDVGRLTSAVAGRLAAVGIRTNDVVAICVPRGLPAAIGFLGVSRTATAAPLNIASTPAEIGFALEDLQANALVFDVGTPEAVLDAAKTQGIPMVPLDDTGPGAEFEPATADDIALILHTSGTTAAPKSVPLRHRNLLASAVSISETLSLTAEDHCLGMMPLFHIHGLVGCLLSTLVAGGSMTCTQGLDAPRVMGWLRDLRPTWYSAVPTMHHTIADRIGVEVGEVVHRLRFVRSSSSAMPPTLIDRLEKTLGVPVIEAYGMTEASHQMTSNPLPPAERHPGSVGVSAGAEVMVIDGEKECVPGMSGEIVVRGPGVFDGYRNNPEATESSFIDGWFRTGDIGSMTDGVLTITGRVKEIINRGGEKISPRQIDETMLTHPAVSEAMAFAVDDDALGERVAAVCVLEAGYDPTRETELDIRMHIERVLDSHKVPERIVFLDDIPKGPTGKPQRVGVADRLGITLDHAADVQPHAAPRNDVERFVADLWSEVLDIRDPSIHDRFLDLGGDSMLAARLIARVEASTGLSVSIVEFFDRATIAEQARYIADLLLGDAPS